MGVFIFVSTLVLQNIYGVEMLQSVIISVSKNMQMGYMHNIMISMFGFVPSYAIVSIVLIAVSIVCVWSTYREK